MPGVYDSWGECEKQIKGVAGARYKSYESRTLAEQAFRIGPEMAASVVEKQSKGEPMLSVDELGMTVVRADASGPKPELKAIAVDAACSGNPGVMEYQGVYVASRTELFHFKAPVGTNNIGLSLSIFMHWRRKWQPTPVFLPGESQGQGSLVGCRLWGRTESGTTEV